MKRIHQWLFFLSIWLSVQATPPPSPEPLENAFKRFRQVYVAQCDDLVKEMRNRMPQPQDKHQIELLTVLEVYLRNVRSDDIPGVQRVIEHQSTDSLASWANRMTGDTVGFRRVLDELVIDGLANKRIIVDDSFLVKLRSFWKEEAYYSWRFGDEASRALPK